MANLSYYNGIINAYPGKVVEYNEKINNYNSAKSSLNEYISSLNSIIDSLRNTDNIVKDSVIINKKPIDKGNIKKIITRFEKIRDNMDKLYNECNDGISEYEEKKKNAKSEYLNALSIRSTYRETEQ